MRISKGFYHDELSGQTVFRCCNCPHDTFSEDNALGHQRDAKHQPVPKFDLAEANTLGYAGLEGMKVVLATITSEADMPSRTAELLMVESDIMKARGIKSSVFWVDNGSSALDYYMANDSDVHLRYDRNLGQSIARNAMIDYACSEGADLLFMVDGDIEPIPFSPLAFVDYMRINMYWIKLGCIGMYSHNCTHHRGELIDPCCASVLGLASTSASIAWTQYGMFNCEMFRKGLRFDISPCFQGEGWGFEDDDFYCQMLNAGYASHHTKHFTYGHFRKRGSLRRMDPDLAAKVYDARKMHVYNKWISNPRTSQYVSHMVNQTMPVLV